MCVLDLFAIELSSFTWYDTISSYDTTLTCFLINYSATSDFCKHSMHNITYDTPIMTSLRASLVMSPKPY
jgi:hypothetical protein